ncbi:glycosyltransferase [bacterium]|nr:glycosyltransferase [bacterium]
MDENLTRPTCDSHAGEPPTLSIVIPAYNAADDLSRCLQRLIRHTSLHFEIIVADDGSTDRTAEVAEAYGVRYCRTENRGGPALARNLGAHKARGQWILFIDADVLLHPGALSRAFRHLGEDGSIVALFGSYDDRPEASGRVSRFRNLLHHHVHQSGRFERERRPATTFWTGCGLIRRDIFLKFGGFDHERFERPAIEDIELGYRLTGAGHRIVLARDVLCTHLKPWSLKTMVRTDFFQRGLPWSLLMLREGNKSQDLNVDRRQKLAAVSAGVSVASIGALPFEPAFAAMLFACSALAVVSINRAFLGLLRRKGGVKLVAAGVPLLYVYYLVCLTSYATAQVLHRMHRLHHAGKRQAQESGDTGREIARRQPAGPHFATRPLQERPAEDAGIR